jgi:hypothetical protein
MGLLYLYLCCTFLLFVTASGLFSDSVNFKNKFPRSILVPAMELLFIFLRAGWFSGDCLELTFRTSIGQLAIAKDYCHLSQRLEVKAGTQPAKKSHPVSK